MWWYGGEQLEGTPGFWGDDTECPQRLELENGCEEVLRGRERNIRVAEVDMEGFHGALQLPEDIDRLLWELVKFQMYEVGHRGYDGPHAEILREDNGEVDAKMGEFSDRLEDVTKELAIVCANAVTKRDIADLERLCVDGKATNPRWLVEVTGREVPQLAQLWRSPTVDEYRDSGDGGIVEGPASQSKMKSVLTMQEGAQILQSIVIEHE